MPFLTKVIYEEEFHLSSELKSHIDTIECNGVPQNYSLLHFTTSWIDPRYPLNSKLINDLANKEIESLGMSDIYTNRHIIRENNTVLHTYYVSDEKIDTILNRDSIGNYRKTRISMTIYKK